MEFSASSAVLHRSRLITKHPSAGFSRIRIGGIPKQCAVTTPRCTYAPSLSSSSSSLYDVLSVSHKAGERDIKSAYRRMALKYHPDVCPPAEKEECIRKFLTLQEAYDTLSDPLLRQDYDWRLQNSLGLSEGRLEGSNVWEAQLMDLIRRRSGCNSWSWGTTMRSRKQQMTTAAAAPS